MVFLFLGVKIMVAGIRYCKIQIDVWNLKKKYLKKNGHLGDEGEGRIRLQSTYIKETAGSGQVSVAKSCETLLTKLGVV